MFGELKPDGANGYLQQVSYKSCSRRVEEAVESAYVFAPWRTFRHQRTSPDSEYSGDFDGPRESVPGAAEDPTSSRPVTRC